MLIYADILPEKRLALVGIVIGLMLSLSPIPTFIDIAVHSKSTGGYTVAPYISAFLCSSTWISYAVLAGGNKTSLIPLNAVSLVIYFIYCSIFLYFSENRIRIARIYFGSLVLLSMTVLAAMVIKSLLLIGVVATIANCAMFAAPLAVMNDVIRTGSVRYMPFLLSLTSFLCAVVWLLWAFTVRDYFVLVPNALGTFFGFIQLVLYGIYSRQTQQRTDELARYTVTPSVPQE